ncbi:DUF4352 domain-containing protein [Arthrobacter roseus]|uniref:DUF4352 domain-containing protein n=1 Tax=Arthrobacter roseus TaxID=136274 RepID=UPI00196344E3|nr:hypothetical protein [Arthrobacter roseus]
MKGSASPGTTANDQAASQIKGQNSNKVKDPKPTPEPGDPTGPKGGPAFEAKESAPAPVERGKSAAKNRVKAAEANFRKPVKFTDGVSVSTGGFLHGTIEGEGAGIVQGAPYVVIDVTVRNSSKKPFDVSTVVPTMVYGDASIAAAPLYSGVEVQDLSGTVAAGQEQKARYAFQVPADAAKGTLYLDLNGTHQPAVFTGDLP